MKKTVLFVAHHLTVGGVQKSLITVLNSIDYEKYDVTLYLRKNRTALIDMINPNVKVIVNKDGTHYYRKPYALILQAKALFAPEKKREEIKNELSLRIREDMMRFEKRRYFENRHFDIAISYVQGYPAEFTAKCVNADKKILFYHVSNDELHDVHEKIMPCFDKIVGVNENVKNILCGLYPGFADKITYIDNFVDADEVKKRSGEYPVYVPKGKTILCSCGRFARVKGFSLAVEAAKILKDRGIDFLWYFVGDGSEREALKSQIKENGLEKNIVLTGMKTNPYPYFSACDIYVQPSYEESYGLTITEAMIIGRCVVTTATVGGKFICKDGENGVVTDISAEGLAEGISRLLNDAELRNRIRDNLDKTDFGKEKKRYIRQWNELLEEI